MNYARIVTAAVVAWVVSIGIGFLVNQVLLSDLMLANAAAMRPEAEMTAKLPLGFGQRKYMPELPWSLIWISARNRKFL
jgi:hypothetical protein